MIAVFDMDGTVVDSEALAFASALEGLGEFWRRRALPPRYPSRDEMRALVGLPSLDYFARLVPPDFRDHAPEIRALVADAEVRRLAAGEGRLFDGIRDTLTSLRTHGWRLALVSNCGRIYFDGNLAHLGLRDLFDVALCLDDLPTKSENVRRALDRFAARAGVMVGDRAGDIDAGRANGLRTVGCAYGFGTRDELAAADHVAASPADLLSIIRDGAI